MPAARRTRRFSPGHEERAIPRRSNRVRVDRCEEARPAGSGVELRARWEELSVAAGTPIDAGSMLVPQVSAEGSFRALLAENPVLLGRELSAPLLVGFGRFSRDLGLSHVHRIGLNCGDLMTRRG